MAGAQLQTHAGCALAFAVPYGGAELRHPPVRSCRVQWSSSQIPALGEIPGNASSPDSAPSTLRAAGRGGSARPGDAGRRGRRGRVSAGGRVCEAGMMQGAAGPGSVGPGGCGAGAMRSSSHGNAACVPRSPQQPDSRSPPSPH